VCHGETCCAQRTGDVLLCCAGTVQENILFEAPFHADDYDRAITAANLHADFEQLPAGDQTELGEGVRSSQSSSHDMPTCMTCPHA